MKNNRSYDFLAYMKTPMSKESISIIYKANKIKYEKCELFGDFVISLLTLCFDTYMGDDVTTITDGLKHFDWCWKKNIDNFKKEGFNFNSDLLCHYFKEFLIEVFYLVDNKEDADNNTKSIIMWSNLFNYTKDKSQSDMETLLEIYKIFDAEIKPC